MPSNLPPGVTPSMIPGNRPEDAAQEQAEQKLFDALADVHADPNEILILAYAGPAIICAIRKVVDEMTKAEGNFTEPD